MIPDGFQYFLDDFWNFQNVHQIWTLTPRIYHQNTKKYIRKFMGTSFKNIICAYLEFKKVVNFGKDGHRKMMKIRPRIS